MAVEFAQLAWENGSPLNLRYRDIYFSRQGAREEVKEVFLRGNGLPERWRGCRSFVVGETGFGTGLNFFVSVLHWLELAPPSAVLHYFSVEKFPLSADDMGRAAAAWPELQPYVAEFIAALCPLTEGYHRRYLFRDRVVLTLGIGDAASLLSESAGTVDAWYLDGFAPSKNPDMWDDDVLSAIARLSAPGSTFSTFTAAGHVRRRLIQLGFEVSKVPGYGGKRERLQGDFCGSSSTLLAAPWFAPPEPAGERRATVIGAGIGGLSVAAALARRGWDVTVFESRTSLGGGASGGPASLVAPKLGGGDQPSSKFILQGFGFAVSWLNQLQEAGGDIGWRQAGMIDFAVPGPIGAALEPFIERIDAGQAIERCGSPLAESTMAGIFIPAAGWVLSGQLLRALASGFTALDLRRGCEVAQLRRDGEGWCLLGPAGDLLERARCVIVAQGGSPHRLWPDAQLPLRAVRGQTTELGPNGPWRSLRCAVRADVHVAPLGDGCVAIGATYDRDRVDDRISIQDNEANLAALAGEPFGWAARSSDVNGAWAAVRLTSPDYLPVVGPAPDIGFFRSAYADLHHGKKPANYPLAQYLPGLYALTAFGSHGFTTAPLAAEMVADHLTGAPPCVGRHVRESIHPARFLIKQLKRRSHY